MKRILSALLLVAMAAVPSGTREQQPRRYEFKLEASLEKVLGANMVASPRGPGRLYTLRSATPRLAA